MLVIAHCLLIINQYSGQCNFRCNHLKFIFVRANYTISCNLLVPQIHNNIMHLNSLTINDYYNISL